MIYLNHSLNHPGAPLKCIQKISSKLVRRLEGVHYCLTHVQKKYTYGVKKYIYKNSSGDPTLTHNTENL